MSAVDDCNIYSSPWMMRSTSRSSCLDYFRYVKRALPLDDEHPREHIEASKCLMILLDFSEEIFDDPAFQSGLSEYFASYGKFYSCKYCHEKNFDYVLIEFDDRGKLFFKRCRECQDLYICLDQVDRVILDKPHFYNDHTLHVMKFLPSNIDLMNEKYARQEKDLSHVPDVSRVQSNSSQSKPDLLDFSSKRAPIDEMDLQNEVFRLQECVQNMNDDFAGQRKQLKEQCGEELRALNEQTAETRRLQQELEESKSRASFIGSEYCSSCLDFESLLRDYERIHQENEALNEEYLSAELENFEITSDYEQILAEERAKTVELEAKRARNSQTTPNIRFSSTLHRAGAHSARSTRQS